jgi:hypothetical protein
MTGTEFIQFIKAKLNRLDTAAYEDLRPEEVLLYANDAHKNLLLNFDIGNYSPALDVNTIKVYLAGRTKLQTELALTDNALAIPTMLKLKDVEVYVSLGSGDTLEEGWMPTRDLDNYESSQREEDAFRHSFPDEPVYRVTNSTILFLVNNFTCTKIRYEYLEFPEEITEGSTIVFPYMKELQDATVTSLLETLESRRIQSQAVVSKT